MALQLVGVCVCRQEGGFHPEGPAGRMLGSSSSLASLPGTGACTGTETSDEEEKPAACPKANG